MISRPGSSPRIQSTQIVDAWMAKQRMGFFQRNPRFRNALLKWTPFGMIAATGADRAVSGLTATPESLIVTVVLGALVSLGLGWMVNVIAGDGQAKTKITAQEAELEAYDTSVQEWERYAAELEAKVSNGNFEPGKKIFVGNRFRYLIKEILGEGTFAVAVLVESTDLGRQEVLKCYKLEHLDNEQAVASFDRECRTLAKLSEGNKHIPEIYQYYPYDSKTAASEQDLLKGRPGFSMQYVEGDELSKVIANQGVVSLERALSIALQIFQGLKPVHEAGIIHRDMKPDNVKITADGMVMILDFGIAKDISQSGSKTQQIIGTPEYMAPEQWDTSKGIDWKTDQYAIGAILWEMLHGEVPFPAKNMTQAMQRTLNEQLPQTANFGDITRYLDPVLKTMLAKDPNERYQSYKKLTSHLSRLLEMAQKASVQVGPSTVHGHNPLGNGGNQ
jgi:serine/threonine protein kinase